MKRYDVVNRAPAARGRRYCGAVASPSEPNAADLPAAPGDADEPVRRPRGAIANGLNEIAVGVESERLAGQVGELVEVCRSSRSA